MAGGCSQSCRGGLCTLLMACGSRLVARPGIATHFGRHHLQARPLAMSLTIIIVHTMHYLSFNHSRYSVGQAVVHFYSEMILDITRVTVCQRGICENSPFKILEASCIQVISNNKGKEAVPFIDSN